MNNYIVILTLLKIGIFTLLTEDLAPDTFLYTLHVLIYYLHQFYKVAVFNCTIKSYLLSLLISIFLISLSLLENFTSCSMVSGIFGWLMFLVLVFSF